MKLRRLVIAFSSLSLCLLGCASVDFARMPPGRFEGVVFVMWVGEGSSNAGDGRFLFLPDPNRPLIFHRHDENSHGAVIKPSAMYTDGGSIPRPLQIFAGLSPWGYAPAYMIHDWLFEAHHCLVDGHSDPQYEQVADVTFDDSAVILGEAIQALMASNQVQRNDLAGQSITAAVESAIAKNMWDAAGSCGARQVSRTHLAQALGGIGPPARRPGRRRFFERTAPPRERALVAAKIIARVSFDDR